MRELGYDEERNLIVFYRYAEGKSERLADLATVLVGEKPDLLLALGGDVAPSAVVPSALCPSAGPTGRFFERRTSLMTRA